MVQYETTRWQQYRKPTLCLLQVAPDQGAIARHKEATAEHNARLADLEKATADRDEVRNMLQKWETLGQCAD